MGMLHFKKLNLTVTNVLGKQDKNKTSKELKNTYNYTLPKKLEYKISKCPDKISLLSFEKTVIFFKYREKWYPTLKFIENVLNSDYKNNTEEDKNNTEEDRNNIEEDKSKNKIREESSNESDSTNKKYNFKQRKS